MTERALVRSSDDGGLARLPTVCGGELSTELQMVELLRERSGTLRVLSEESDAVPSDARRR